jgi:hypothetical protein
MSESGKEVFINVDSLEPRKIRSKKGADSLLNGVLSTILMIPISQIESIIETLKNNGDYNEVIKHLKILSLTNHNKINEVLDDMGHKEDKDNTQVINQSGLRGMPNSDWNPDEVRKSTEDEQQSTPEVVSNQDFDEDSRNVSESFFDYFVEANNNRVDAALASLGAETDSKLDPATRRRVQQAQRSGKTEVANKIRRNGLRRSQSNSTTPTRTPAQARVDKKKKELINAVRRQKEISKHNQGNKQ